MIKIQRAQNWDEIKNIVLECFRDDEALLNKYHIKAGSSLSECVDDTCGVLKNGTNYDFTFYKLVNDAGMICGFIGVEPDSKHLTTFCLKKRYRVKEYRDSLWKIIVGFLGEDFNCGLYAKNYPAINFLTKNGCIESIKSTYNNNDIVILKHIKKEEICH
jgi:hypothetical protein